MRVLRAAMQQAHRIISLHTVDSMSQRHWSYHANRVITTQVPLGSRVEMWELRISPRRPYHNCTGHSSEEKETMCGLHRDPAAAWTVKF